MITSCTTTASSGFFRSFKPSRAVPVTRAQANNRCNATTLTRPVIWRADRLGRSIKLMDVSSPDKLFAADDGNFGQPHSLGGCHQMGKQLVFRVLVRTDMNFRLQIHFGGGLQVEL